MSENTELTKADEKLEKIANELLLMMKYFRENHGEHRHTNSIIKNLTSVCNDANVIRTENISQSNPETSD